MTLHRKINEIFIRLKYAAKLNKPLLLVRIAKIYWDSKVHGITPLKYLDIAFDYRCNLRCQHCFARVFENPQGKRKLDVSDYVNVVEQAMKLGCVDLDFQGGEPLIADNYKFLKEILRAIPVDRNLISITTNGTNLTKEVAEELKELGVDNIFISIDSGLAEEHDKFRGVQGTWEKAIKGIDNALGAGLTVAINTTLVHKSIFSEGFRRLVDLIEEKRIFVNTIFPVPVGRWKDNTNVILHGADYEELKRLRNEHPLLRRDVDNNIVRWGCCAVKEALYITPYGDTLACPFIHISLGNVQEEPLKNIREVGMRVRYFDHYHQECLCGEDRDFMKKYAMVMAEKSKLPADWREVRDWWGL